MYLKRIEIVGFKSFADRTEIDVAPGVTAVVGPNGSGKSNIADAVRFVLGEQSPRSLRGARMEEVIFAGSDARKGVNVCEVALTLDNVDGGLRSEFAEVTVSRRLYRSGESEYFLCGSPCRLRDIAELFMDTGVGREAYSIIGQGRIDEILSIRSEDRRGVFEEAAGIITWKVRRKDAHKRLGDAEQNIERLSDLLGELTRQLQPLAERAQRARSFQEARSRRDALQIGLLAHDIAALRNDRALKQLESQRLQAEEAKVVAEQDALRERVTALREQSVAADRALAAAQNELVTATARAEQCEADRRVTDERWRAARERCSDLETRIEELAGRLGALEAEAALLRERRSNAREEADGLERALAQVTGDGRSAVVAAELALAQARSDLIERMREQASRRSALQALQAERDQAQRSRERGLHEMRECEQREAELQADIARAQAACREAEIALRKHERQVQEARAKHEELAAQAAVADRALDALRRELSAVAARRKAFEELEKAREGFANGPKAVLAAAAVGRLKGVRGAIADLIQVESMHAVAIETALGSGLQNIVVDSEEHARAAIAELRRRHLGRATFLPLSTVRGRRVPLHELQLVSGSDGFVGLAADLAKCRDDMRRAVDFLLGACIVAATLEHANRIARVLSHRVRVVTLEGDVVNAGGSMTGGSVARGAGSVLTRMAELEALALQEQRLQQQIEAQQAQCAIAHKQLERARLYVVQVQDSGRHLQERAQAEQVALTAHQRACVDVGARRARAASEVDALADVVEAVRLREQGAMAGVQELEQALPLAERAIADCERLLALEQQQAAASLDEHTDRRVALSRATEAAASLDESVRVAEQRSEQTRTELAAMTGERDRVRGQVQALEEETQRLATLGAEVAALRDAFATQVDQLRARRGGQAGDLEAIEEQWREASERKQQLSGAIKTALIELTRTEAALDARVAQLRDDHQFGFELAQSRYALEQPAADARADMEALDAFLASLGDVSIESINDFEELQQRHAFLTEQYADLIAARAQLQDLIAQLDREMEAMFAATFEDIRGHFAAVFRRLFGGGRADVRLVEPGDPLASGIEIVAEPPGKRMTSLTLLSGGERALTALALLLAILLVKPVPFCVLDEVEAALDDANVVRFAQYLKEFAERTQFVLITHRRGTMEAADVLYGVTMHEAGISRLVSVRMEDDDQSRSA